MRVEVKMRKFINEVGKLEHVEGLRGLEGRIDLGRRQRVRLPFQRSLKKLVGDINQG